MDIKCGAMITGARAVAQQKERQMFKIKDHNSVTKSTFSRASFSLCVPRIFAADCKENKRAVRIKMKSMIHAKHGALQVDFGSD